MPDELQLPPSQSQKEETLDLDIEDEETKIREDIAKDFNILISRIKIPFDRIFALQKQKIIPYSKKAMTLGLKTSTIYFLLNEQEEQDFFANIRELNETLGASHSTLDSYIKFTKSSPDFEKFLNMFFIFVENYTNYRTSIFFQVHAESGKYLYPFFEVDNVLVKLQFLFARLCGTLSIGARWTVIQPPTQSHSPMGGEYGTSYDRPYHDFYDPLRYNEQKPKYRDIGDSL